MLFFCFSPKKLFKTPTKRIPSTPDKNELMSPKYTDSKRILFSPSKQGSPSKLIIPPAYQRYQSLIETNKAGQLALPFKYRHLIEIFKAVESVCAMMYNRRECITFKKLKPAVQRMLRKNFNENHLAQIKEIYGDAYKFTLSKMRNFGSCSKADYFQLVITPNIEAKHLSNDTQSEMDMVLNPQIMTQRLQYFQSSLLNRVYKQHDTFLKSLQTPLIIPKEKVTRWHPDFDLENCEDIVCAALPKPPNVEKYASARDILSTARNLFNDATTPIEETIQTDRINEDEKKNQEQQEKINNLNSKLLRGLPTSLLEKIRAKQAAKSVDAMTRRPSQDREATKYSRLPDIAKHLRNLFITERKNVLTLELITKKLQNSFRTSLTAQDIEEHLKLIAKEVPEWLNFHEVRRTNYIKIFKELELKNIIEKLENAANKKSE